MNSESAFGGTVCMAYSKADLNKLYRAATFLINRRGYLVVSLLSGSYVRGQVIRQLWDSEIDQPLTVLAETDKADWDEQRELASSHFEPEFKRDFYIHQAKHNKKAREYWRVITD